MSKISTLMGSPRVYKLPDTDELDDALLAQYMTHHRDFFNRITAPDAEIIMAEIEQLTCVLALLYTHLDTESEESKEYFESHLDYKPCRTLLQDFAELVKDEFLALITLVELVYFQSTVWKVDVNQKLPSFKPYIQSQLRIELTFTEALALRMCLYHNKHYRTMFHCMKLTLVTYLEHLLSNKLWDCTFIHIDKVGMIDKTLTFDPLVKGLPPILLSHIAALWKDKANYILDNVLTDFRLYNRPVTSLVFDHSMNIISGIKVDFDRLQSFLRAKYNIQVHRDYAVKALSHLKPREYNQCVEFLLNNHQYWKQQVRAEISTMTLDTAIQDILSTICLAFYYASDEIPPVAVQQTMEVAKGAWGNKARVTRLKNNQRPSGNLLRDLQNIKTSDLIELLQLVKEELNRSAPQRQQRHQLIAIGV